MMDEKKEMNVYTGAEVRKYLLLKQELDVAQTKTKEQWKKIHDLEKLIEIDEEVLDDAANKFIRLGWKIVWHGIFIKVDADPSSFEVASATEWLNKYWKAKSRISSLRSELKELNGVQEKYCSDEAKARRKVSMYLELFPGIDSAVKS